MPYAKLEFNLPEENLEFMQASKSQDMAIVLWEFDQFLRNEIKYQGKEYLQEVRDHLRNIMFEYDLNVDQIIE